LPLLDRIAYLCMDAPIATDITRSVSVCLCVGHTDKPCKNGRTDLDAFSGADSCGHRNHVLDIVIRVSVCLFVCLFIRKSKKLHIEILPNFLYMLPVAVARLLGLL